MRPLASHAELGHTTFSGRIGGRVYLSIPSTVPVRPVLSTHLHAILWCYPQRVPDQEPRTGKLPWFSVLGLFSQHRMPCLVVIRTCVQNHNFVPASIPLGTIYRAQATGDVRDQVEGYSLFPG